MPLRGVRGATTCEATPEGLLSATRELLEAILQANPTLVPVDIASVWFTVTDDLQVAFPAKAARELGWTDVPLMDALEINIPGSLPHCVRVLIHWNTNLPQNAVRHVYLREAIKLRPDLVDVHE